MNLRVIVLVAAFLVGCSSDESVSWVDEQHAMDVAKFGDDPNYLVQRGLLADRKHQYIDLLAHASGANQDSRLDVILASLDSETTRHLARAEVTAAQLKAALEFIGLSPGHPIDVENLLYWPKGERVTVSFYWDGRGIGRFENFAIAEHLLIDTKWNAELPELGFRFVGSSGSMETATELVTAYNSRNTLLEVSYTVNQNTVLERSSANPAYLFAPDQQMRVRLRPEYRGDRQRVRNYSLEVEAGAADDGARLPNLVTSLRVDNSDDVVSGGFEDVFVYLEKRVADGEEPFVQFQFSDAMLASSVRDVATFASQFLVEQQIRIEPTRMEPYISAFLPNDAWRDPNRRGRVNQPLEIHTRGDGTAGALFQYIDAGNTVRHPFNNLAELDEVLKTEGPWQTDGVFLFVRPDTPYSQIRRIYDLVWKQYSNFYVFS